MEMFAELREDIRNRIDAHRSNDTPTGRALVRELTFVGQRLDRAIGAHTANTPVLRAKSGLAPLPPCLPERTHAWHWHTKDGEPCEDWKTCKHCGHSRAMEHGDKVVSGREKSIARKAAAAREQALASVGLLVDLGGGAG